MRNQFQHAMVIKGLQAKLGRVAIGWSVLELAATAKVSTQTIVRLEKGEELRASTLERIKSVMEAAGVTFISNEDEGVFGITIRMPRE